MTAGSSCRSCGTELRANARYCDECGAATAVLDTPQYKQVTVLFADVVRSTDLAAAIDLERLRAIMTDLLKRSTVVIERFGGTTEYNGDGVMALFGAPIALEDHGFRACLAALALQEAAEAMACEVRSRDGVSLQLRVGLNSGRVIAGDLGSGSLGYAATGETVGFAQRMESAAPPGGVLLSESTARLVEHMVMLADPELVRVKGFDEPVQARRLLAIASPDGAIGRSEAGLVGRRWEMAALEAIIDRGISGRGGVVNLVGPPGIGKSRVAREAAALAKDRGVKVFWTFCESHARDVPFHAVTRLLRAGSGITDIDDATARLRLRDYVPPDADPQDLLLLDDLLGIADPEVPLPQVDPDVRRRRLTALVNSTTLARTEPALFIIEDVHWVDAVSESMLADFLTVVARTPIVFLITGRPEYDGALTRVRGGQAIALVSLNDSDSAVLVADLLGSHPSVGELASVIVDRADGNPFFAEEMVREVVQRGVLTGDHGRYICNTDVAEVSVPATVEAAIEARIDRLAHPAKCTLNAASVIGARFEEELLTALGVEAVFDELLDAELIDQIRFTPTAEYAFRHPLIRAVAYESQLKSDRAESHRRLAVAIEERDPASAEENAALIAEHLESAGEPHTAYVWHMRAGAWAANRAVAAARLSWDRARQIADTLPSDDPERLSMRIAPRTMLCATVGLGSAIEETQGRFAELRELCTAADDKVSLAIGMSGPAAELLYSGRSREGSRLASEQMTLLESTGDRPATIGLAPIAFCNWADAGEFSELLQRSQTAIDLAEDDPARGAAFGFGSPLAAALAWHGTAQWWLGRPGWPEDFHDAIAMARDSDPATLACVAAWTYGNAMPYGVSRVDDSMLDVFEEAVRTAVGSSDVALGLARYTLGIALLITDTASDRERGLELIGQVRDLVLRDRGLFLLPVVEVWIAREQARRGDRDAAIAVIRQAADDMRRAGRSLYGLWSAGVLVEALLERGADGDLAQARIEIARMQLLPAAQGSAALDITLLRLRALMAHACRDDVAYKDFVYRYRTMAKSLGFEGHTALAEAMVAECAAIGTRSGPAPTD